MTNLSHFLEIVYLCYIGNMDLACVCFLNLNLFFFFLNYVTVLLSGSFSLEDKRTSGFWTYNSLFQFPRPIYELWTLFLILQSFLILRAFRTSFDVFWTYYLSSQECVLSLSPKRIFWLKVSLVYWVLFWVPSY